MSLSSGLDEIVVQGLLSWLEDDSEPQALGRAASGHKTTVNQQVDYIP